MLSKVKSLKVFSLWSALLIIMSMLSLAQSSKADNVFRRYYITAHLGGAWAQFSQAKNLSSGNLENLALTKDSSGNLAFVPDIGVGVDWRFLKIPFRSEIEFTARSRIDYKVRPLFKNPKYKGIPFKSNSIESAIGSQSLMINNLLDFNLGWRFSPFIGWGIGMSWNDGSAFRINDPSDDDQYIKKRIIDVAWSAIIGLSLPFGEGWIAESRLRFVDLGKVNLGPTLPTSKTPYRSEIDGRLRFYEFGFGVRYQF